MNGEKLFFDTENVAFIAKNRHDMTPRQRANLRLLNALLADAYGRGFRNGHKAARNSGKSGIDISEPVL